MKKTIVNATEQKRVYVQPKANVVMINSADIIATSDGWGQDNDGM